MEIRHAEPERDAAACAGIYEPFVRETAVSFEEIPPGAADFARRIERVSRTHPWLVAEYDGEVAGYAYASSHRERAAYRWAADVAIYMAVGYRRRGAGSALYEALLGLLARQGFRMACAGVTLPNEASVGLHEACGFRLVGVYQRIGWKGGAWHDVGWWQLELPGAGNDPPTEPGDPPTEPGPPPRLDRLPSG